MLICGIDEARRGPVIGPLVLCGILIDEKDEIRLIELEVKDSKLLTSKKREELAKKIKKVVKKYELVLVYPKEIDRAVNKEDGLNLNLLEANKIAYIINKLKPDKAIVDCPSPNINSYKNYLKGKLNFDLDLVLEHKAERFPVVAAASILAKVTGDDEIKKIEKMVGESVGTGYPSNPICQKFLKENWEKYPDIFRKSWITWQDHKITKMQKKLGDF